MGSSNKQQQQQSTTQEKNMWAEPYMQGIAASAQNLYGSGAGSNVWSGPALAPLSGTTQEGLGFLQNTARNAQATSGVPYQNAISGVANGGITAGMQQPMNVMSGVANGQNRINTGGMYGGLMGLGLSQNQQPNSVMGNIAQNGVMSQDNPYLQQMLDANAARTANRVNSAMSGAGRFGSYAHGDQLARSIGEVNNPILAQAYENDQNRRLQDAGLRLNAASGLADSRRADLSGASGLLSGLTGVQSQNISNQMGAAGGLLDNYARAQGQAQQWAAMAPELNNLQYDPANRLMAAGGVMDARAQAELDQQRQLFEQQNAMPWTQLARYQGAVSGLSPLMANAGTTTGTSTGTTTTNQSFNPLSLAPLAFMAGSGGSMGAGGLLGGIPGMSQLGGYARYGTNPFAPNGSINPLYG